MSVQRQLRHLRRRANDFHFNAGTDAERIAAEINVAVAQLDGHLPDDGKAIAFAADFLLHAVCPDIRSAALQAFQNEIAAAMAAT